MCHLFGGIAFLFMLFTANAKPASPECGQKAADFVFVLDASSSIWEPNFQKQLDFVNSVVDMFDVGSDDNQTQVGVLTFSDYSWEQFPLDTYGDKETLKGAVKSIPYKTGGTNTSDALRTTRMKMFSPKHSPRENIVRIAVVITDGQSEDTKSTYKEAMALKSSGIQVFAVGVGFGIDESELEVIASSPASQFVFTVDDFGALSSIRNKLAIRTCKVTQMTTVPTTTTTESTTTSSTTTTTTRLTRTTPTSSNIEPSTSTSNPSTPVTTKSGFVGDQPPEDRPDKICQGKSAEVFFLLDSSSSILMPDFNKQLSFIQNIVNIFDVGSSKTRVGLSTFSDVVSPVFNLDSFKTKPEVQSAMKDISYLGGGTETGDALQDMRIRGMAPEIVRREVAHVAIVLTDGQSRDPELTAKQAKLAKQQGIYIFAIGIGDNVDMEELADIASYPAKRFVFHVNNYAALESIKDVLAIRTCEVHPADEPKVSDTCPTVPTDVMFVYDSGKIGLEKSAAITSLIGNVADGLPMSRTEFHFGVLSSTCSLEEIQIPVTPERSAVVIKPNEGERRDLSSLFQELRTKSFLPGNGGRAEARQVALLFLDGALQDHEEIVAQAQRTKARGVEIYVIGTGNDVNMRDVRALVSGPLSTHYLHLPSYTQLSSQSHRVEQFLCQDIEFTIDEGTIY